MKTVEQIELYAWVGEDELGSGEVGLKQGLCPAGLIPLVAVRQDKMQQEYLVHQMAMQAKTYGKKIKLCRFVFDAVILETP